MILLVNFLHTGGGYSSSLSPQLIGPPSRAQEVALERFRRLADIFVGDDLVIPTLNREEELSKRALDYRGETNDSQSSAHHRGAGCPQHAAQGCGWYG